MDQVTRIVDPVLEFATKRCGDWMQTVSGRAFWPLDPQPEDIDIGDIAHALSMCCRFAGHSMAFYSVAEHSYHVSTQVSEEHALQALLHDATEAYIGDMVRPLKQMIPQYREIESDIWAAIALRFGVPFVLHPSIKAADNAVLLAEKRELLTTPPIPWHWAAGMKPAPVDIKCWSSRMAQIRFLSRFNALAAS